MIYDCFTFFNELDLLEIRLNALKDVVDRFVLVESDRTFTNHPKALFYEQNKQRFAAFSDRIIHVIVKDFPPFKTAWHYETYQRNAIARGLAAAQPSDTVLIGDLDEIPNPNLILHYIGKSVITAFQQRYYAYYLNFDNVRRLNWIGTKMLSYRDFQHCFDQTKVFDNEFLPAELNVGTTASKIRCRALPRKYGKTIVVGNGGWHFTCLGGAKAVAEKMRSFSHQEYNPGDDKIDETAIQKIIENGGGTFWKMNCFAVPIDEAFPAYIRENQAKYAHLIFPVTSDYMKRVRFGRFFRTVQGRWIQFAEWACPAALHNWLHLCKMQLLKRS